MLIDRTKKKGVVTKSQERLSSRLVLSLPTAKALVNATAWVNGKNTLAITCTASGRAVIEKNVPLRINIGVVNRMVG